MNPIKQTVPNIATLTVAPDFAFRFMVNSESREEMECGKDKTEPEYPSADNEVDRKIDELKKLMEKEKEDRLEKLIIEMLVSSTLKEYYEKNNEISKVQ